MSVREKEHTEGRGEIDGRLLQGDTVIEGRVNHIKTIQIRVC